MEVNLGILRKCASYCREFFKDLITDRHNDCRREKLVDKIAFCPPCMLRHVQQLPNSKANKLRNLQSDKPDVIATANIGCQEHLRTDSKVPVVHWIEFLE